MSWEEARDPTSTARDPQLSPEQEGPISNEGKVFIVIEGGRRDTKVCGGRVLDNIIDKPKVAFSEMELEVGNRVDGDGACKLEGIPPK